MSVSKIFHKAIAYSWQDIRVLRLHVEMPIFFSSVKSSSGFVCSILHAVALKFCKSMCREALRQLMQKSRLMLACNQDKSQ